MGDGRNVLYDAITIASIDLPPIFHVMNDCVSATRRINAIEKYNLKMID